MGGRAGDKSLSGSHFLNNFCGTEKSVSFLSVIYHAQNYQINNPAKKFESQRVFKQLGEFTAENKWKR